MPPFSIQMPFNSEYISDEWQDDCECCPQNIGNEAAICLLRANKTNADNPVSRPKFGSAIFKISNHETRN
jgi:hypothetical protein